MVVVLDCIYFTVTYPTSYNWFALSCSFVSFVFNIMQTMTTLVLMTNCRVYYNKLKLQSYIFLKKTATLKIQHWLRCISLHICRYIELCIFLIKYTYNLWHFKWMDSYVERKSYRKYYQYKTIFQIYFQKKCRPWRNVDVLRYVKGCA